MKLVAIIYIIRLHYVFGDNFDFENFKDFSFHVLKLYTFNSSNNLTFSILTKKDVDVTVK